MAIKAIITAPPSEDPDGTITIFVRYTDEAKFNKVIDYHFPPLTFKLDTFKQLVANQLASFPKVVEDASAVIVPGDFDPGVVEPPVNTPLQQFKTDLQILRNMEKAIAQGFKKNTDADYVAQTVTVKTELAANPEFIQYL